MQFSFFVGIFSAELRQIGENLQVKSKSFTMSTGIAMCIEVWFKSTIPFYSVAQAKIGWELILIHNAITFPWNNI